MLQRQITILEENIERSPRYGNEKNSGQHQLLLKGLNSIEIHSEREETREK